MPADIKPLFRADALRPKLGRFVWPPEVEAARPKLARWAALLASGQADAMKETELLADFLHDIFSDLLGYTGPASGLPVYTLKREALVEVDGKFADAALGRFPTAGGPAQFVVAVEGKGPRDPLDRPFAGRRRSAVDQALQYAVNLQIDWYLVTNLKETRLYHKGHDMFTFERFETAALAADATALRKFVYLLGAERVVPAAGLGHLDDLLAESRRIGRELTNDYYHEYATLRRQTFDELRKHNPDVPPADLIAATQKILDRVLFIAFCEDRGLLPNDIIASAYQHRDKFNPRPVWDNFLGLFRAVNEGSASLEISRYNGGLFAADAVLDRLKVPDVVCQGFAKIASYEYGHWSDDPKAKLIDVEILGHIFEQSISDLEDLQRRVALSSPPDVAVSFAVSPTREQGGGVPLFARRAHGDIKNAAGPSKRKKEGAFYTPEFVTRYIVAQTLGPVLAERFEAHRSQAQESAPKTFRKLFDDPRALDPADLKPAQRQALVKFWNTWHVALGTVRVVDPACGSGAFLIEAFEQLSAEYLRAVACVRDLGEAELFDVDREILESNLYGMDLNAEAVEIARLSLWIKTAQEGKVLTSLDDNVKQGNSVVAEPAPLDAWRTRFPAVFAEGGFDVVIGNPPYVRQEWIAKDKPFLEKHYRAYHSVADLFVYFYELGFELLRPGGRLGYITSGGWVRGNYGEGLRKYLAENAGIDSMIDFGEYQPFADAEMIRPTIAILSKRKPGEPMRLFKWLTGGPPPENLSDVLKAAPTMRTDHLGEGTWELETDDILKLRQKLVGNGVPLTQYCSGGIYYGIKTGLNEVFVIDERRRKELVDKHKSSNEIIKPFIQGTNIRPWHLEASGQFVIFCRRGIRINDYPAVREYLAEFREALEPKPADWQTGGSWRGRKQGSYQWFELQDTVDYWAVFEQPKIIWPDITNRPRFVLDRAHYYVGDTGFVIPGTDAFLLGILSSWASWFSISKTAQPLRLRSERWQYRLKAQYMENVPIPDAPKADRAAVAALADRCNQLGALRYQFESAVRGRLTQSFGTDSTGQPLGKLNEKAEIWWEQPLNGLGAALKTSFKLSKNPFASPKAADEWEPYLKTKAAEVEALRSQLADAEAEINERVYKLFELTREEVRLLQREVEH